MGCSISAEIINFGELAAYRTEYGKARLWNGWADKAWAISQG
jgi:hypothetical protein